MTHTLKLRRILAVLAIASVSTGAVAKNGDTNTDSYAHALDCNETGAHLQIVTFDHDKLTSVAETASLDCSAIRWQFDR
jgi:hypothetical protein